MSQPSFEALEQFNVSRESYERLQILVQTLKVWQPHINLISPTTMPDVWQRHVVDSLQLIPLLPPTTHSIADLGSGGGFPGLVLAATQPAEVHMYEANGKKVAFLHEALRQMKCTAHVHRQHLNPMVAPPDMPSVQVVTARAFAPLDVLLGLAEPFMRAGAIGLFHKGQDVDTELTEAARSWKIDSRKHVSLVDSRSVILEVKEIAHV